MTHTPGHTPGRGRLPHRGMFVGDEPVRWHPPKKRRKDKDDGSIKVRLPLLRAAVKPSPVSVMPNAEVYLTPIKVGVSGPKQDRFGSSTNIELPALRVAVRTQQVSPIWGTVVNTVRQKLAVNLVDPTVLTSIGPTVNSLRVGIRLQPIQVVYDVGVDTIPLRVAVRPGHQVTPLYSVKFDAPPLGAGIRQLLESVLIVSPSSTKYIHNSRSQGSVIVAGMDDNFKFSTTATAFKRGSNVNVLHLAEAKVTMATVQAPFVLVGGYGVEMDPGEWVFMSDDKFLKIVNVDPIQSVIVLDGDTTEIDMVSSITTQHVVTNLQQPKVTS